MRIGLNCMILTGQYSGVEQSIWHLVRALRDSDSRNEYVLYTGADTDVAEFEGDRWEVRRTWFKGRRKTFRILWEQLRLPQRAIKDRLDLVHCPGYVIPSLLVTASVVTIHDVIALKRPELCRPGNVKHFKMRLPKTAERATRIIVPSNATRNDVVDLLEVDREKVRVVPFGVGEQYKPIDDPAAMEEARRQMGLPEKFILFVGNREPKKNLEALVQAFYAAVQHTQYESGKGHRKAMSHKLVLVGKRGWGDVDRKLSRLVRELKFQDHVLQTGYLPQEVMPYVYNLADALVFPSLIEGFGFPVLEAMACGTPVICSKDPALRETVGDAALVVDGLDRAALRKAIEKVTADAKLRRKLREKGLARAAEFTWARCARQTMSVYEEARRVWDAIGESSAKATGQP